MRNFKHGHKVGGRSSKELQTWQNMMSRCYDPKNKGYKNYGERGIRVCERWHNIENFFTDVGKIPPGMTLDRYPDNNGNYGPGNWRLATRLQQGRNTRRTRFLRADNKTQCLKEWSIELDIPYATLHRWLKKESLEQIIEGRT